MAESGYLIFLAEEEASWLAHVVEQIRTNPREREGVSDRRYAPAVWAKLDAAVPTEPIRALSQEEMRKAHVYLRDKYAPDRKDRQRRGYAMARQLRRKYGWRTAARWYALYLLGRR